MFTDSNFFRLLISTPGLGAVASPLVFQVTVAAGLPWPHFYFGSLVNLPLSKTNTPLTSHPQVLAAVNYMFLGITFMPTAREFSTDRKKAFDEADAHSRLSPPPTPDSKPDIASGTSIHSTPPNRKYSSCSSHPSLKLVVSELRLVSSMPYQWAVSLLVLFYCGRSVCAFPDHYGTLIIRKRNHRTGPGEQCSFPIPRGSFNDSQIVQYLLAERSANPNTVGYVTSGFWAGICASRLVWSYFSPRQVLLAIGLRVLLMCDTQDFVHWPEIHRTRVPVSFKFTYYIP